MPGTVILGKSLSCCTIVRLLARFSDDGRSCGGKLVPCALLVEAERACGKPSAGVDLRIYTGERHDLGDSSPLSTRT